MSREDIQLFFLLNQILEPFLSTKETGKGTGLGLSNFYGIIKQHNVFTNINSEPDHGSTFKVYPPTLSVKHESKSKNSALLDESKGNG